MGEPQNNRFYDFEISGRVHPPQKRKKQCDLSFETPGHIKQNQENTWNNSNTYYLYTSQKLRKPNLYRFWKRRAPTNDEDPLNKILRILDVGSMSS